MRYLDPATMKQIHSEIKYYDVIVTHMKSYVDEPSIAYAYQVGPTYILKIYDEFQKYDAYDFLLAHEVRHVTHGHFNSVINDITFDRIKKIIEDKVAKMESKVKQKHAKNDKNLVKKFFHYFHNIASDMEVNSKLLPDYQTFIKQTDELMTIIPDLYKESMGSIPEEKRKEHADIAYGVHPSNLKTIYGTGDENIPLSFPVKMDFIYYMEELVKNVNFDSLSVGVVSTVTDSNMNRDGDKQQSQSNQSKDGKKDKSDSLKEVDDFKESNQGKKQSSNPGKLKKLGDQEKGKEKPNTKGNSNETEEKAFQEYEVYYNLRKYILNKVKIEAATEDVDMLYNYNRRKFSTELNQTLIPRARVRMGENFANTVIITDVSGSMSEIVINNIVQTIFHMRLPARIFKLVTWNTNLIQDIDIKSSAYQSLRVGGGTDIATAFPYVKEYLNGESRLFVISDLEDSLQNWKDAMAQLPLPEKNIFVIDVYGGYMKKGEKLFTNYHYLFKGHEDVKPDSDW